jgi:cytochrome c oxidase subunit 1
MMAHDSLSDIHLPPPSYWPIVLALGLLLIAVGIIFGLVISVLGVIVLLVVIAGWTQENRRLEMTQEMHHD